MLTAIRAIAATLLVFAGPSADPVREQQQWVLDALNVQQAWTVTKGRASPSPSWIAAWTPRSRS